MTSYTDKEIAAVAWAANAELQALHGDPAPSLPGDAEDAEAHAVTVAGIRAILDGATPEQLHETWMRSREAQGWTYGPRKDSRLKTHPALVPYAELPEHQRVKDRVFTAIVRAMTGQDYGEHVARPLTATPGQAAHQAETVAIAFHQAYEELAPQYGYRTREASAKSWDEMPAKNAALMVATAARLLETGMISVAAQEPRAVTDMLGVAVQALRRITEGGTGCDPQTVAGSALGIIDRGIPGELRWDLIPVPEPELQPAPELAALQAERDCYRFALAQIAAAAEVAPDASRAGLGRIADQALAENNEPMAAQEPHAAPGALEPALRALKALDELFKIDSDLRNPWNARALTIVLRGLGRGGTADEEITAALGLDPQPAPGIPLRSDAETADMLRADLADAEAQLARWPKCPAGCNCRIGIEDDPDRNECGCDGPCNGGEQPAPEADVALASIAADRNQLRMALSRIAMGTAGDPSVAADKALAASSENARRTPAFGALEPQPAPELAAAKAKLRETAAGNITLRDLLDEATQLLADLGRPAEAHAARRIRKTAGLLETS